MNKLKKLYLITPKWLKNKYFLSGFLFFIWIAFFDTHSIKNQIKKERQIKKIEKDIKYYSNEIEKDLELIQILSQDTLSEELEKYFREKMFLSKKNEEIFMIE
ncbi:MAG: septum formation initiator [Flavobacteriales bacterium]|nr:septum formation initiator [Flavobacteriales bacterium]|tara:strand:+ start:1225 stop:1533 length:309 start_codon:yes stop_codon:yes gene_type:complete